MGSQIKNGKRGHENHQVFIKVLTPLQGMKEPPQYGPHHCPRYKSVPQMHWSKNPCSCSSRAPVRAADHAESL